MVSKSVFSTSSHFVNSSLVGGDISPVTGQGCYERVQSDQIKHAPLNLNCEDHSFLSPDQGLGDLMPSIAMSTEAVSSNSCGVGSLNGEAASNSAGNDFSKLILEHISNMLMEENTEEKLILFYDPLVQRATEESLHDVIVLSEKNPALLNPTSMLVCQNAQSPYAPSQGTGCNCGNSNRTGNIGCTDNSREKLTVVDNRENSRSSFPVSHFSGCFHQSTFRPPSRKSSNHPQGLVHYVNQILASPASKLPVQYDSLRASLFNRGVEDIACTNVTENDNMFVAVRKQGLKVGIEEEQEGLFYGKMGKKSHEREELCEKERRINKQSAASMEEIDPSDMFDRILLFEEDLKPFSYIDDKSSNATVRNLSPVSHTSGSSGRKNRSKKDKNNEDMEYLRNLLILCAQAISTGDNRNASDLLKKIRLHSSPVGNACQRLAHVFANGLDARLAGTAVENLFKYLTRKKKPPTAEILEHYQTHYKACPFNRIAISFADNMILRVAKTAKTLHVVDFGILLGFQWPLLIQLLSRRPGGPPKLRLTGIELPQHGLKPEETAVETGCSLAKYCKRFGVPFEYNAIVSQYWETIKVEELKIRRNEVLAVNCRYRFENLLDETVVISNPRDNVLKLIRDMRPDIFVLSIINGNLNSPFFIQRFQQALFHFSALYDMFNCSISRDNQQRLLIEREIYGRKVMNIIGCEGMERVERPETYKQWHTRVSRTGFKPLALDKVLMKIYIDQLKVTYHKDVVILEDGNWMLQGWKGRVLYASSIWELA